MRRDEKDESGGKVKWREESCVEQRVREKEEVEKGEGSISNGTSPPPSNVKKAVLGARHFF